MQSKYACEDLNMLSCDGYKQSDCTCLEIAMRYLICKNSIICVPRQRLAHAAATEDSAMVMMQMSAQERRTMRRAVKAALGYELDGGQVSGHIPSMNAAND